MNGGSPWDLMLRLLHTADWHLGHTLHDLPREREHDAFLSWLLDQVQQTGAHALLIAGDIFDAANPPASAMRRWYRFLATARARFPTLDVVAVGGNHDSAARLDAAHPLLADLGLHVVGGLPRDDAGDLLPDRLVIPLTGDDGGTAAWIAAVPFLRPADLPAVEPGPEDSGDALVAGVRALYRQALNLARARRQPGQALLAMGHCYMVGGALSELSERKVLGGNQHALPSTIFPADIAYVALGHLHRAQAVGGRDTVRYSGSPIPLAVDEAPYPHQVRLLEIEGDRVTRNEALRVPRSVPILRLPDAGPAVWDQVAPLLQALPAAQGDPTAWPYLEVRVLLPGPMPDLRHQVEAALDGRGVRLVRLAVQRTGDGRGLAEGGGPRELSEFHEEDVLRRKWQRDYDTQPPDDVLACFHELLDRLGQQDQVPGAP